ncbi:MAG TPA: hypothetical protein PKW55_08305 [Spirochaetota bacterium]|nr:hypothetical protein [Spirochaetota bacterium]HOM39077.1 hypothetical protein [Spirochaetota bacterium]HPQ49983.1 hypothetical protein [Spirochaetota bacterium]
MIKEISIFVENQKGKLSTISKILGDNNISIKGFSVDDTGEGYGIFRIVPDYWEKAEELLKKDFTISVNNIIAVKVEDKAGSLYKVLKILSDNKINLEYTYLLANSIIALKVDNEINGIKVLKNNNIELIENNLMI